MNWREKQTFYKKMCSTGSTASIISNKARIFSTLQWLHLGQLQFCDGIFQRDGTRLPWHQFPTALKPFDLERRGASNDTGECEAHAR